MKSISKKTLLCILTAFVLSIFFGFDLKSQSLADGKDQDIEKMEQFGDAKLAILKELGRWTNKQ